MQQCENTREHLICWIYCSLRMRNASLTGGTSISPLYSQPVGLPRHHVSHTKPDSWRIFHMFVSQDLWGVVENHGEGWCSLLFSKESPTQRMPGTKGDKRQSIHCSRHRNSCRTWQRWKTTPPQKNAPLDATVRTTELRLVQATQPRLQSCCAPEQWMPERPLLQLPVFERKNVYQQAHRQAMRQQMVVDVLTESVQPCTNK